MSELDFKGLASVLLSHCRYLLPDWCPGGRLVGREYTAGTINGGPGDSFKCNVETGLWCDFATDQKGSDLISLFAEINRMKNGEAARILSEKLNYRLSTDKVLENPPPPPPKEFNLTIPPLKAGIPNMIHPKFGVPVYVWTYKTAEGNTMFYEARYQTENGKQFLPWSWDANSERWVAKGYNVPRPLYNLDLLAKYPEKPVMILEGPKCCDVFNELTSVYVPVTWCNGASAVERADWSSIFGKQITIWPDADQVGIKAANKIVEILSPHCSSIKVLNVDGMPSGWDVHDAVQQGWDFQQIKTWAKDRIKLISTSPTTLDVYQPPPPPPIEPTNLSLVQNNLNVNIIEDESNGISDAKKDRLSSCGVRITKNGTPIVNMDSVMKIIENDKQFNNSVAWFDEFHQKVFTDWNGPEREWSDKDTLLVTHTLQREYGLEKISTTNVHEAVTLFAHKNSKNEPKDWMENLKYDGISRLETFFSDYMGVFDSEYSRAVSLNFWVGMVARIYRPGCKVDNMVVLEGPQGAMKSTALHAIGGKWFCESHANVMDKDFYQILHGKLIVEIAELHTFSKAEVTRIKGVITCQTDRYRAPYERHPADHPRMSIFVGTTNEDKYLRDTTGNRRFWPIRCGNINIEMIREMREPLFAEAVFLFKQSTPWWTVPDIAVIEQDDRRQTDAWENVILEFLNQNNIDTVTVQDIATRALNFDLSRLDMRAQIRISNVMRVLKWVPMRDKETGLNYYARSENLLYSSLNGLQAAPVLSDFL